MSSQVKMNTRLSLYCLFSRSVSLSFFLSDESGREKGRREKRKREEREEEKNNSRNTPHQRKKEKKKVTKKTGQECLAIQSKTKGRQQGPLRGWRCCKHHKRRMYTNM